MTESQTPPKTAQIHEFKPWDYERMFRLARRLWQRPEEPDPEAAEVNDVAGSICYLLCRAMESGALAPTCPHCLDELTRYNDWPAVAGGELRKPAPPPAPPPEKLPGAVRSGPGNVRRSGPVAARAAWERLTGGRFMTATWVNVERAVPGRGRGPGNGWVWDGDFSACGDGTDQPPTFSPPLSQGADGAEAPVAPCGARHAGAGDGRRASEPASPASGSRPAAVRCGGSAAPSSPPASEGAGGATASSPTRWPSVGPPQGREPGAPPRYRDAAHRGERGA